MKKQLEINKDYAAIFGLDPDKGQQMIYLGGILWEAREGERTMRAESQQTTDNALEYINRPRVHMGW